MLGLTRRSLVLSTAAFTCLAAARPACAAIAGSIEILDAWARASGKALETSAYLTMLNHGTATDWLVGLGSPRAERAELRRRVWHGLAAQFDTLPKLEIPPMARTKIVPGGVEIHLTGLTQPIHDQDELPLTLTFTHAGQVDVAARVTRFYLDGQ